MNKNETIDSVLAFLYEQQKKRKAVIPVSDFSVCGYNSLVDVKLVVAKLIEENLLRKGCSLSHSSLMFLGLSSKGEELAKNISVDDTFTTPVRTQSTALSTELSLLIEKIEESEIRYKNKVVQMIKDNSKDADTLVKVFASILQRPQECKDLIFDIGSVLMKVKQLH